MASVAEIEDAQGFYREPVFFSRPATIKSWFSESDLLGRSCLTHPYQGRRRNVIVWSEDVKSILPAASRPSVQFRGNNWKR